MFVLLQGRFVFKSGHLSMKSRAVFTEEILSKIQFLNKFISKGKKATYFHEYLYSH